MKYRLDMYLVMKGLVPSRERAKSAIESGEVFVDGKECKPSQKVDETNVITLGNVLQYVSRGALKLEKAKQVFDIDFKDRVVLDIGSSTGGFTEVALLGGAKEVVAVDVGTDLMHERIRNDKRVKLYEKTDIRFIEKEKLEGVDLIVSDVSFISLGYIIPRLLDTFGNKIECIFLFKPQFECGKEIAKKYFGVIRNKLIHLELLTNFERYLNNLGFKITGIDYSPITGKEGNIEYLFHLNGMGKGGNIKKVVEDAFKNL